MKARKITFYLGIIVFVLAGCGIDNGGWWYIACLGGLALSCASVWGRTKREVAYIFNVGTKFNDYKF